MVDPGYGLHRHIRSMSSLASTIIPISTENDWRPSALPTAFQYEEDLAEGLRVPLPPSTTCSENGQDTVQEMEQKVEDLTQLDEVETQLEESHRTPANGVLTTSVDDERTAQPSAPQPRSDPRKVEKPACSTAQIPLPLEELIQMIRKDRYETDRLFSLQHQVHELMYTCALFRRCTHLQSQLYRLMIDRYRSEDKTGFDLLYKNSMKLRESCTTTNPFHLGPGSSLIGRPYISQNRNKPDSWVYKLSVGSRNLTIRLLLKIRTKPTFLANRLIALSYSQLSCLTKSNHQRAAMDSVFQVQTHGLGGLSNPWNPRNSASGSRARNHPQEILSYDPLSLLLRATFDDSLEPDCMEYRRRVDVWSTACAQIILDGKHGSDELTMLILDDFANSHPWSLKAHLEIYLMGLLQDGAFVLDSMENPPLDFTRTTELSNARSAVATSEFFDRALRNLINLISPGSSKIGMPDGMLDFIRAILDKIQDPDKRVKARNFIVSRWYCTSFLSSALIHPEIHGIMMKHHVSSAARQKILHELAIRLQKQFFEVLSPWKSTSLIGTEIEAGIEKFLTLFQPGNIEKPASTPKSLTSPCVKDFHRHYLAFSPQDFLSIVKALVPEDHSENHSFPNFHSMSPMPPSSAGSSTLTTGTAALRTGTASSNAPSFSGTSMTSNTVLSEISANDPSTGYENNQISKSTLDGTTKQLYQDNEDTFNIGLDLLISELEDMLENRELFKSEFGGPTSENTAFFYIQENGENLTLTSTAHHPSATEEIPEIQETFNWETEVDTNIDGNSQIVIDAITRLGQDDTIGTQLYRGTSNDLEAQLRVQINTSQADYDFQSAHFWWKSLQALQRLPKDILDSLLVNVRESLQARTQRRSTLSEQHNSWCLSLHDCQGMVTNILRSVEGKCEALRDKMWYMSDIKHSSTYEDAMNVTRALRSMVRSAPSKQSSVAAWARHRLKASIGFERAQMQTFEALAADQAHGGPTKLADQQADLTSRWLTDQSIENFCKGEERIHRFCLEVQKCINKLVGESLLKSPVLWSSTLYHHEGQLFGIGSRQSTTNGLQNLERNEADPALSTTAYNPFSNIFNPTSPPYTVTGQYLNSSVHTDSYNVRYSTLEPNKHTTNLPSQPHTSPGLHLSSDNKFAPVAGATSLFPSSSPSISSSSSTNLKQRFISRLKQTITSLFLSDLGYLLWNRGSETDRWISDVRKLAKSNNGIQKIGLDAPESIAIHDFGPHTIASDPLVAAGLPATSESDGAIEVESITNLPRPISCNDQSTLRGSVSSFPYFDMYEKLLTKFSLSSDPFLKIQLLYELTLLAKGSLQEASISPTSVDPSLPPILNKNSTNQTLPDTPIITKARTRTTPLEEVIANCEERRRSTLPLFQTPPSRPPNPSPSFLQPSTDLPRPDILPTLRTIISSSLRPPTLFRDLQYIAALVPPAYLDTTPQGRAFWAVGLASLSLKVDACVQMVQRANEIVAFHLQERPKKVPTDSNSNDTVRHTAASEQPPLETAAHLYTVAALEGDTTAARELALFYLTAPELVPRVTLPLSRPTEVFRSSSTSTLGPGSEKGKEGKEERLDPLTFAVAFHWMEFAANGGDGDAKAFLKGNGELGKGW